MLIEIGFQLSFLAVLGIILFYGPLLRLWVPHHKFVGYIWSLIVMSLAAQALTTPLSLYLFKAFPVWFLPANLIVVTAAGVAVYGAVALLVLFRVPYLGGALVFLLTLLLLIVDKVTAFFAALPGAYPAIRASFADMILLYVITFLIAMRLMWGWRSAARWSLVASVLLLLSWGYRAHTAQDRITFTVYDDRRALQAAISVGRALTLLNESDSLDAWLATKADRHVRVLGLDERSVIGKHELDGGLPVERGGTLCGRGRWSAPDFDVYFHGEKDEIPVGLRADVVVLSGLRYLNEEDLSQLATGTGHVVLAGGLPWKLRAFTQCWCDAHGIHCHDVREKGAFVLEKRVS
jgi:competence protein ComEC